MKYLLSALLLTLSFSANSTTFKLIFENGWWVYVDDTYDYTISSGRFYGPVKVLTQGEPIADLIDFKLDYPNYLDLSATFQANNFAYSSLNIFQMYETYKDNTSPSYYAAQNKVRFVNTMNFMNVNNWISNFESSIGDVDAYETLAQVWFRNNAQNTYQYSFNQTGNTTLVDVDSTHYNQYMIEMDAHASKLPKVTDTISFSYSETLDWDTNWELRQMHYGYQGGRNSIMWHIVYKPNRSYRYTTFLDLDTNSYTPWTIVE